MIMKKSLYFLLILIFVVSCSDNETIDNQGPSLDIMLIELRE